MTMVRQSQSPTQSPLDPSYRYDTASGRPSLPRLASASDARVFRAAVRGQTQPKPTQYAIPLSRHNSFRSQASVSEDGRDQKAPEHMLKRKTPKGTLAAAYDGTPVADETERQHPSKHIVLPGPTESSNPYNLTRDLPLRYTQSGADDFQKQRAENSLGCSQTPSQEHSHPGYEAARSGWEANRPPQPMTDEQATAHLNQRRSDVRQREQVSLGGPLREPSALPAARPGPFSHMLQPQTSDWSPSLYFRAGSGRLPDVRQALGQAMPQFDSMLSQMPPLQPPHQYAAYPSPLSGVMQAPMHSFGPTVSNDQGPYGPYWHDGTFIPYQPAALRDPRYFSHHGTTWNGAQHDPWTRYDSSVAGNIQQGYNWLPQPIVYNNPARPALNLCLPYPQASLRNPHNHPFTAPLAQTHPPEWRQLPSDQAPSTPVPTFSSTQFADYGSHSSQPQTKEGVFSWAHTVYLDYLKFLRESRKANPNARHPNGPHAARSHIYPTPPPRQPSTTFITNQNSGRPSLSSASSYRSDKSDTPGTAQPNLGAFNLSDGYGHQRSSSMYSFGAGAPRDNSNAQSWQLLPQQMNVSAAPIRPLRRSSGTSIAGYNQDFPPSMTVASALDSIIKHCEDSQWTWIDGMLLGGCLAYALGDYQKAQLWYERILALDKDHVEATSNLAATLLGLHKKGDAEMHWRRAVKSRPNYFEAVEHLVGLLCGDNRAIEAVQIIEEVERSLKISQQRNNDTFSNTSEVPDRPTFNHQDNREGFNNSSDLPGSDQPGFGSSGYAIPGSENCRILALVHAKGNMLYSLGDNTGAAKAFEDAVLIGVGRSIQGIGGLIKNILTVVGYDSAEPSPGGRRIPPSTDPVLLDPINALQTARLCFPPTGELPGLKHVPFKSMARNNAISTTSNSLLSLAKIFQDGMATNSPKPSAYQTTYAVREILALYYLSLSLQPSPSTANNVGILLASVQQSAPSRYMRPSDSSKPHIPGLVPGSGVALALEYYNYGLQLDKRHAHLYTNLGSLLKDIGQLDAAIQMYEHAVAYDGNFDIALANLANAVKDKGRISDAITFYKRAVKASPKFAEAVCGLANALNSVCDWKGRGGIAAEGGARDRWHVDDNNMLRDATTVKESSGWIKRVVDLVVTQLADGEDWGLGTMDERFIEVLHRSQTRDEGWIQNPQERKKSMVQTLSKWRGKKWEGARVVRLVERAIKRLMWHWYQDIRSNKLRPQSFYQRPQLPSVLTVPAAPTVLPFHTFTCPMSASQIRMISQRNGLRISCSTLKAPWLPSNVYPPPPPPRPHLNVGYVSSDFNNHPLAHLMQSVFGLHDGTRVKAFCYATTASDRSEHRLQIEREAPVFYDSSSWSAERLVNQIVSDEIHILVNLNGYTRGARNEVFAARPAPIQMSFMGFAGTLGAEWCDYLLADDTAVPPDTLRSWRRNVDMEDLLVDENNVGSGEIEGTSENDNWIYGENIIFCRDTFFCCDHRQSAPDAQGPQLNWEEEQERRWAMRKEIFPLLPDDAIILGNFNQLYKVEPTTYRTWLRILQRVPNAILWLLRFPDLGETNLKQTALTWAGAEVASRVIFTEVAQKQQHIARARVCDLFLDTPECNAHTTSADILWSGTPLLTLPRYKYKMCSRMAASILKGALPNNEKGKQAAKELVATSEEDYENKAAELGLDCVYRHGRATGRLSDMRKMLYEARWTSALFDTRRWVRDLEDAYEIAWKRWENGDGGDIWLEPQRGF